MKDIYKSLNQKEYKEIILAALFHDIGKFSQRTRNTYYKSSDESTLCPFNNEYGYFTHKHVLYTDGFFNIKHKFFEEILPDNLSVINIQNRASRHHKPQDNIDLIITISDHISSGSDRSNKEIESEDRLKFYKQPLMSIFNKVSLEFSTEGEQREYNNLSNSKDFFHKIGLLTTENVYPLEGLQIGEKDYNHHWNKFLGDLEKFKNLKKYSYNLLLKSIDSILEQYLWCIPSSTKDEPDISLYDHLITTAAFASVLYQYHYLDDSLNNEEKIKNSDSKKFLFLSGDLSGIQSYIFDLKNASKNAKLLRARSFELRLITESVSNLILNYFHLPHFCTLMNAGGRFLLLLPNIPNVKDKVDDLRFKIEKYFVERYFGEIALNISDVVEASAKDLNQKYFIDLYNRISLNVNIAKNRKFQTYLLKSSPTIDHEYNKIRGNENICDYCQKRAKAENMDSCDICYKLISLGSNSPKYEFLLYKKGGRDFDVNFMPDGTYMMFDNSVDNFINYFSVYKIKEYEPGYPYMHTPYHLPVYTQEDIKNGCFVKKEGEDKNIGDIKLFEDIELKADGYKKLAMLKADVDFLGFIFRYGLGKRISISRYTSLSRMLNYFFTDVLNDLIVKKYPDIYVVFAGGDDLCLIGPWDKIFDFSIEMRKRFKDYVGKNKNINISAGIALFKHNLPLKFVTEMAERELEKSKNYGNYEINKIDEVKNRITVFDTTMSWGDFERAISIGNDLLSLLEEKRITKGFVYRLLKYYKSHKNVENGKVDTNDILWRSHFAYDVARNIKDEKDKNWIKDIVMENIDILKVVATYTLYKKRD